jgi:hypothetical protein
MSERTVDLTDVIASSLDILSYTSHTDDQTVMAVDRAASTTNAFIRAFSLGGNRDGFALGSNSNAYARQRIGR